jgi:hypothetical protein
MITAIISGSVALIIFAATQIFLHLRDRQTLLRAKLEDLFSALNDVSAEFMNLFYAIQAKDENKIQESFRAIDKSFYRPRALILLYFPYITDIWEDSVLAQAHELVAKVNGSEKPEDIDPMGCKVHIDKAALYVRYLQNFLARNQELSTETFAFYFNRFFRRRVLIKMPPTVYDELNEDGMIKDGKIGSNKIEVEQAAT